MSRRRLQAIGLSEKICSALAPICRDRRAARSSPRPTPRCMPTAGASAGHLRRRRGSRCRATVPVMQDASEERPHAHPELEPDAPEPEATPPERGELDLLTIGLAVFFVALIAIVAAMLVLATLL